MVGSRFFQLGSYAVASLMALILVATIAVADARAAGSVQITGKAYAFNHMDTFLVGATIKVRELPSLSAVTDANGDYDLTVPDDTNVTPYIDPPAGYNEVDLQTFHTRGQQIENANFQTPADLEYAGLKAILEVPSSPDGRPAGCAIVTTSSARNVRGVDYQTFWDLTPHGVAGTTATEFPALDGPIYFNEFVIPDKTKTESSGDGGIVWTEVPTGNYRITGSNPNTGFASFLATCEPGRIINANPPWGMYELSPGEKPLGASMVAASMTSAKVARKGKKGRTVSVNVKTGEQISAKVVVKKGGKTIASKSVSKIATGQRVIKMPVSPKVSKGKATVTLKVTDAAGESVSSNRKVNLPNVPKKQGE